MKKRVIGILTVVMLLIVSNMTVLANESSNELVAHSETSSTEEEIEPYVSQVLYASGTITINGKKYDCSTKFVWTKNSSTLYYAGMWSSCVANTKREYSVSVKANTTYNGYKTVSGSASYSGKGEHKNAHIAKVPYELDSPNYINMGGTCKISYGGKVLWTGVVYK